MPEVTISVFSNAVHTELMLGYVVAGVGVYSDNFDLSQASNEAAPSCALLVATKFHWQSARLAGGVEANWKKIGSLTRVQTCKSGR